MDPTNSLTTLINNYTASCGMSGLVPKLSPIPAHFHLVVANN
ncbi:hypothetical protein [Companilactobacillus paralimentarius]|nr:hypothetical protein [Companilactobacillus paralimentarius]